MDGIPDEAWPLLDDVVEIPMVGRGASLNVAVAGSLVEDAVDFEGVEATADLLTAVRRTAAGTGGALAVSALTSVLGFGVMALAPAER